MVEKAISQLGRKLAKWSAPSTPAVVDFFSIEKHESRLPRWIFENPDTLDEPIASLGVESLGDGWRLIVGLGPWGSAG